MLDLDSLTSRNYRERSRVVLSLFGHKYKPFGVEYVESSAVWTANLTAIVAVSHGINRLVTLCTIGYRRSRDP
jgi:hypothetical protein